MVVDTWSQALVSMYMASRMLNLGMALLLPKAAMMRQTKRTFKKCLNPLAE